MAHPPGERNHELVEVLLIVHRDSHHCQELGSDVFLTQ